MGRTWRLAKRLTVAQWRQAKDAAVIGDDKHSLRQFKQATILLEAANHLGLAEDACLMAALEQLEPEQPLVTRH